MTKIVRPLVYDEIIRQKERGQNDLLSNKQERRYL
jgi:hypothetical protein